MSPLVRSPLSPSWPKRDTPLPTSPAPIVAVPAAASPLFMNERRFAGRFKLFNRSFTISSLGCWFGTDRVFVVTFENEDLHRSVGKTLARLVIFPKCCKESVKECLRDSPLRFLAAPKHKEGAAGPW